MREREAGDSLLDLGKGWEPIKGVRGSRKSSRTASDPLSGQGAVTACGGRARAGVCVRGPSPVYTSVSGICTLLLGTLPYLTRAGRRW